MEQSSGLNGRSSAAQTPDLLGTESAATSSKTWPRSKVYDKHDVTVNFDFSKASGQPALTDIQASYTTTSSSPITKFSLQVNWFFYLKVSLKALLSGSHAFVSASCKIIVLATLAVST